MTRDLVATTADELVAAHPEFIGDAVALRIAVEARLRPHGYDRHDAQQLGLVVDAVQARARVRAEDAGAVEQILATKLRGCPCAFCSPPRRRSRARTKATAPHADTSELRASLAARRARLGLDP